MASKSKVKSTMQKVNGLNFYCEIRGSGPTIALVPSGEGDCGSFTKVADMLADEFTVFTLDMRYMSRSERPRKLEPIAAEILASDVAGLLKVLGIAPASVYGCSSGGQCVLSMGVDYPELCRNLMVHEAALLNDAPPGGAELFSRGIKMAIESGVPKSTFIAGVVSSQIGGQAYEALGPEYNNRVSKNGDVWIDLMLGYADQRTYSTEELVKMPPLIFSVGLSSQAWLVECSLHTARKAKADVVWLSCQHFPQITIPELFVKHIRKNTKKHLN